MDSKIYLKTAFRYGKTKIDDVYFSVPYKITAPFYDGKHSDIMLMSASAGLMKGDMLDADYIFGENSDVSILSQSYEKAMNTEEGFCSKNINITIEKNAKVYFTPLPVIPFAGSDYRSKTTVQLDSKASFFYSEVFSCGRIAMNNERFQMTNFSSKMKVYVDHKLAFADHTKITPQLIRYNKLGLWNDYSHNGLLYVYLPEIEQMDHFLEQARAYAKQESNMMIGASKALNGIVVRVLANSGDKIIKYYKQLEVIMNK